VSNLHVEREIRAILRDELRVDVPDAGTDLLESGLVDSLGFVDLVAAIERRFDIVVSLVDVDLDEFRTVGSIATFVRAMRARSSESAPAAPEAGAKAIVTAEAG
jgi:acyl carrier protein